MVLGIPLGDTTKDTSGYQIKETRYNQTILLLDNNYKQLKTILKAIAGSITIL